MLCIVSNASGRLIGLDKRIAKAVWPRMFHFHLINFNSVFVRKRKIELVSCEFFRQWLMRASLSHSKFIIAVQAICMRGKTRKHLHTSNSSLALLQPPGYFHVSTLLPRSFSAEEMKPLRLIIKNTNFLSLPSVPASIRTCFPIVSASGRTKLFHRWTNSDLMSYWKKS